jgi:BarA-like signal transduction histidine kinase
MTDLEGIHPVLVVQPGDKLVVVAGSGTTREQALQIHDEILARAPELADVIIVGVDQIAVIKAELAEDE